MEGVTGTQIELGVARQVLAIGNTRAVGELEVGTQAGPKEHVGAEARVLPKIGPSGRSRDPLLMIETNVVAGDVGELLGREVELRGHDVAPPRTLKGEVAVGGKAIAGVVGGELDTGNAAVAIVERSENDWRAELAFIDQILRWLVVAVDSERQAPEQLLLHADVVVVGALGRGRGIGSDRAGGQGGAVEEFREGFAADQLERRRGEIARIAGVQRRVLKGLPDQVDPWAELAP